MSMRERAELSQRVIIAVLLKIAILVFILQALTFIPNLIFG